MILSDKGIGTYVVRTALGGVASTDYGVLCTHPAINMWSKWKPVRSTVGVMTSDELKFKRYGLEIIVADTPSQLMKLIKDNNDVGVYYDRPTSNFRIGDFRNYNSDAECPVGTSEDLYVDGKVDIGGITSSNHAIYEKPLNGYASIGTEYQVGTEDLYNFIDQYGQPVQVRRGAIVTDGVNTRWSTDRLFWWNMTEFRGKTVDIYEFYTNAKNTPDSPYYGNVTDKFYALPSPHYRLTVSNKNPAGSQTVNTLLEATFVISGQSYYDSVDWSVRFDAIGDVASGGTIRNVYVSLCRDRKGTDVIKSKKISDSITVKDEEYSPTYTGNFKNEAISGHGLPDMNVYIAVFFDYKLQAVIMPEDTSWEIQSINILRSV